MQSKYKIVLSLSQELNIPLEEIQKYVQWYKVQTGINYDFVNCFSCELENDIKTFIAKDYLSKKRYAFDLEMKDKLAVQGLKNKIAKGEEFVLPKLEFQPQREKNTLFTIGYEGISIDTYINKLLANHIKTLVDVRKNAYSNKFGFSKKEFQYCLEKSDIKYIHIPELGIESEKRQELKTAKNSSSNGYDLFGNGVKNIENKLFEDYKNNLPSKQRNIERLLQILEQDKLIAITCFEADYKCCHRHVLAESLSEVEVVNL
ncbi:DUF488 domain-containing protein [Candidatus Deianiraea vastatrix]|uniref:DUF488 domain-containing protein n=1 Tax=Candidatus Deianiraea vastatrix TaxID=2163644 RepID=A0A5B8XCH2_9RICK|nr:DUF488 domain-containing protein [Candidatus Deianiraea vastatrix]QED23013.1 hypothetical protein Deia_00205 [Candidatus Deianiraea vastatrix]